MSFTICCPNCKKKIHWDDSPFRPFCSDRCRLADLAAWASGDYCIPCDEKLPEEEAE